MMFCDRLRAVRIARGYTQQQVCDGTYLSIRTYQRYESGTAEPALATIHLLADFFDIPIDLLFGREQYTNSKSRVTLIYLPRRSNGFSKH